MPRNWRRNLKINFHKLGELDNIFLHNFFGPLMIYSPLFLLLLRKHTTTNRLLSLCSLWFTRPSFGVLGDEINRTFVKKGMHFVVETQMVCENHKVGALLSPWFNHLSCTDTNLIQPVKLVLHVTHAFIWVGRDFWCMYFTQSI